MPIEKNSSNGAKAFVGAMAVATLATFGWMLWQAQSSATTTLERLTNQRLSLMENVISDLAEHSRAPAHPVAEERYHGIQRELTAIRVLMHEDDVRELADVGDTKAMTEKLREIETQFRHIDQFVQLLWQRVYAEPLPNPPSK